MLVYGSLNARGPKKVTDVQGEALKEASPTPDAADAAIPKAGTADAVPPTPQKKSGSREASKVLVSTAGVAGGSIRIARERRDRLLRMHRITRALATTTNATTTTTTTTTTTATATPPNPHDHTHTHTPHHHHHHYRPRARAPMKAQAMLARMLAGSRRGFE